jgi:hypothetical protein
MSKGAHYEAVPPSANRGTLHTLRGKKRAKTDATYRLDIWSLVRRIPVNLGGAWRPATLNRSFPEQPCAKARIQGAKAIAIAPCSSQGAGCGTPP